MKNNEIQKLYAQCNLWLCCSTIRGLWVNRARSDGMSYTYGWDSVTDLFEQAINRRAYNLKEDKGSTVI